MKISYLLLAIGVGLIVGGPAFIQFNGYDALSVQFWLTSLQVLVSEPKTIIGAAFDGNQDANLFQGVLMIGMGVMLIVLSLAINLLYPVLKSKGKANAKKIKPMKASDKESANKKAEEFSDDEIGDDKSSAIKKPSALSLIKDKLKEKAEKKKSEKSEELPGSSDFVDEVFDGEKSEVAAKGFLSMLRPKKKEDGVSGDKNIWQEAVADVSGTVQSDSITTPQVLEEDGRVLETEAAPKKITPGKPKTKINKKTASLKIRDENSIQAKISGFFSGLMNRGNKKDMNASANFESQMPNRSENEGVVDEVYAWYGKVQEGNSGKLELVSEARDIMDKMSEDDKEAVIERSSMDGTFVLRLLTSWAAIDNFEDDDDGEDSKAALREAVRALKDNKGNSVSIDETKVPEDFMEEIGEDEAEDEIENDVDDEPVINWEKDDSAEEVVQESDVEDTSETGENEESQDDAIVEKIGRVAKEMQWIINQAKFVQSGEDEWPEHLSSEEFRMEEVVRLEEEMGRLMFLYDDTEMKEILETRDEEGYAWLLENFDIVTGGFEVFAKPFIQDDEGAEDDDGSSDDGDINDEPIADEDIVENGSEEEKEIEEDVSDVKEDTLQEEAVDDTPQEEDTQEDDNASDVDAVEPKVVNEEQKTVDEADDMDPIDEGNMEAALASIAEQREADTGDSEPEEFADEDDENVEATEIPEEEEEVEYVPQNITKSDMDEMHLASEDVLVWGTVMKKAGAGAGTMMRFLFNRSEKELLPIGFVHLVAMWKKEGKPDKRVNVMLKYLDEGEWVYDSETVGLFTRENGDTVRIAEELLSHPEVANSAVIVHVHGPGSETLSLENHVEWAENIWLTNSVMSENDLRAIFDE